MQVKRQRVIDKPKGGGGRIKPSPNSILSVKTKAMALNEKPLKGRSIRNMGS